LLVEATDNVPKGLPITSADLQEAQPAITPYITAGLMHIDDSGAVQVYIRGSFNSDFPDLAIL